jgi:aspartyl-tRNA(Asn)/glutamyl-tRNA(Gln) amidotransferase subunit B
MPELPDATRARLLTLGLSARDTDVLMTVDAGREIGFDGDQTISKGAVAYFDKLSEGRDPKVVVNWMTHELLGQLALRKEAFGDNVVSVGQMGELIDLVQNGYVTGKLHVSKSLDEL